MQVKKDMPKRYHLNRPFLAQAVAVELRTCQDVKSQQRLLAARLAASGQLPYRTKYEWGYLYSALEVDGNNAAEFLCLPEVSLEMSGLFLEHLAASNPGAEHIVIWDQAGFHPKPELHAVPVSILR